MFFNHSVPFSVSVDNDDPLLLELTGRLWGDLGPTKGGAARLARGLPDFEGYKNLPANCRLTATVGIMVTVYLIRARLEIS